MEVIGFIVLIIGPAIALPLLIGQLQKHGILAKVQLPSPLDSETLTTAKAAGITGIISYSVTLICSLIALVIVAFLVITFFPLLFTGQFDAIKAQASVASSISDGAYTLAWISFVCAILAHIWTAVTLNPSRPAQN